MQYIQRQMNSTLDIVIPYSAMAISISARFIFIYLLYTKKSVNNLSLAFCLLKQGNHWFPCSLVSTHCNSTPHPSIYPSYLPNSFSHTSHSHQDTFSASSGCYSIAHIENFRFFEHHLVVNIGHRLA